MVLSIASGGSPSYTIDTSNLRRRLGGKMKLAKEAEPHRAIGGDPSFAKKSCALVCVRLLCGIRPMTIAGKR